MRLGICEVCAAKEAIYACPKCEVKTCSLPCVRIHKKELQCDGQRDRTKFVPLSEMTAREFMSDYCFLEECTRYTENRKTDKCKNYTHENRNLPQSLHRLRSAAKRRNINLRLLLPNFSRRKENTTYLDWKRRHISWRIEWLFVNIPPVEEGKTISFVDARCDETLSLAALALKYVDLDQETARDQRKHLIHHQSAGIGQLSFWLRAEGVRNSKGRCYRLKANQTLSENLAGKTIVEFPTIFVNYEQKPPTSYHQIESDEEFEEEDEDLEAHKVKEPAEASSSSAEEPQAAEETEEEEEEMPESELNQILQELAANLANPDDMPMDSESESE